MNLTRRENYPIFGDIVTFSQGHTGFFGTSKEFKGVISEHNIDGPQLWEVTVDGRIMHVYGSQITKIERTGTIPECPTVEYDPATDPDLQSLASLELETREISRLKLSPYELSKDL